MIRLGVNIDHVATLRNARGEYYPDPVEAARLALSSGADGITAHLREDRRHIRDEDMHRLRQLPAPLNFEMAATNDMVAFATSLRPHACCLVPERRQEVTTEGGLDLIGQREELYPKIKQLKAAGIRVSLFIDPDPAQITQAAELGAAVIELHTGAYAHAQAEGGGAEAGALAQLHQAAGQAQDLGLELHAGHGLTYDNVEAVTSLTGLKELNIGHFLISQAVFTGLGETVRKMKSLLV